MQAILNIEADEVDDRLLKVIKELLSKNIEITIKTPGIRLGEFDAERKLDDVIEEFRNAGYSSDFISDLDAGFKTSEIYKQ